MIKNKINWDSNFLIPSFLKKIIAEKTYKIKFLNNFIIVAMLRNFVSTGKNKKDISSIILNKQLITQQINTKNLSTSFTRKVEQSNYVEEHKF